MYSYILFDLDNTILDFDLAEIDCFKKLLNHYNVNYSLAYLETYKSINEELWKSIERGEIAKTSALNSRFSRFFTEIGHEVDGAEAEQIYRDNLNKSSLLMPNAKKTLIQLHQNGVQLYSASNGVYKTQLSRLKNAQILDLFSGHFISEEIGSEKPSSIYFQTCINRLNIAENKLCEVLMVGDNQLSDIIGAKNCNIDTCFYNPHKKPSTSLPKYEINNLTQLIEIALKSS